MREKAKPPSNRITGENPPIEQIISLGIARDLITILSYSEDPSIQYQCAWALTNIACGTNEQTNALLDYVSSPALFYP